MTEHAHDANWSSGVLKFWFSELEPKQWFVKSERTDTLIRERFLAVHTSIKGKPASMFLDNALKVLAAVIVLDQFPRNMFRDTPAAFADDAQALDIAKKAVELGFDRQLPDEQRIFLYLPYEHSEDLADQDQAVALIANMGNENYTDYAEAHRDIIRQFGRFPHRNAILGRPSTPEEEAFLRPDSNKRNRF